MLETCCGWVTLRGGVVLDRRRARSPRSAPTIPANSTVRPYPPASTTPASRSTGSRSGPRLTDSWPASSARSITSAISASCSLVGRVRAEPRVRHVRELGGDAVGHLANDGKDRALGRVANRAVGLVGGAGQGGADQHRVDQLTGRLVSSSAAPRIS